MTKRIGWKQLTSEVICENKYFKIRHDKVIQPDGNEGEYFYIDKNDTVFIVAENKDGKLILVGQSRYLSDNFYSWEFVGGGVDKDDSILDSAKKELKEEAGITARTWEELGFFYSVNGLANEKCFVFLAKDLHFGKMENEATEDIEIKKVTVKELEKMIASGEIICGMTIATFFKYLIFKNKK